MMKMLSALRNMDPKTRWFYFQYAIYMIVIIATTVFCYARLDFVRSYQKNSHAQTSGSQPQP